MEIHDILNAKWLIYKDVIYSYIPYFISFLRGGNIDLKALSGGYNLKPYCINDTVNTANRYDLDDPNLPDNSVAIIPIQGIIEPEKSMMIERYINLSIQNPSVISILFVVNTPGGMVFYTDILSKVIKNSPKPTVAYVMQMAASAGMWLISGTNKRIISSPLDSIGSIGVKTSYTDLTGLLKKIGIDTYDLYATLSTRKDEEIRNLLDTTKKMDERTSLIINDLDFTNDFFHAAISENMGIKRDSEVFTGAIFNAQRGIELGLAHEINTFEYAISQAHQMGLKSKINQLYTNLKR